MTQRRREYTDLGERRACRLPCLSFSLGDDRRCTSGNRNVSLAIFITSVSGSKSLTSFTNRFFHYKRPPGFRLAVDAVEGMKDLAAFSVREVKRVAAEERERDEYCSAEGQ